MIIHSADWTWSLSVPKAHITTTCRWHNNRSLCIFVPSRLTICRPRLWSSDIEFPASADTSNEPPATRTHWWRYWTWCEFRWRLRLICTPDPVWTTSPRYFWASCTLESWNLLVVELKNKVTIVCIKTYTIFDLLYIFHIYIHFKGYCKFHCQIIVVILEV